MGASTLTGIVVKLPAGALSDVFGRRRLLIAGALVFATLPFTLSGGVHVAVPSDPAALRAWLRHGHLWAGRIGNPVRHRPGSEARRVAQHLLHGAGRGASAGARAGWLPDRSGPVRSGVRRPPESLVSASPHRRPAGAAARTLRPHREPWQDFKRGIAEVGRDRLVLVTSGAQAAQFVLNGTLNAFLPLYGREVFGLTATAVGVAVRRPDPDDACGAAGYRLPRRIVWAAGGSSSQAWWCAAPPSCRSRWRPTRSDDRHGGPGVRRRRGHDHGRDQRLHHRHDATRSVRGGTRRVRHDLRRR